MAHRNPWVGAPALRLPAWLIVFILLAAGALPLKAANSYYVNGATGNDGNSGLSAAAAFKTLDHAASIVNPGDTVLIAGGTYTDGGNNWVLHSTRSGTAAAWITFKNIPGQTPIFTFSGWAGIKVDASYIVIDGITVIGNNDHCTVAGAAADAQSGGADPAYNGTAVSLDARGVTNKYNHITIKNCTLEKCGCGGVGELECDYTTIDHCTIFNNAWYSQYGGSGISLCTSCNVDTAAGYHNIISNNVVYNNRMLINYYSTGKPTDGNGIIMDSNNNVGVSPPIPPYSGRTLIYNNLVVNNGGGGVHVFDSQHVDACYNTCYHNAQIESDYNELDAIDAGDVQFFDNIAVANSGGQANYIWNSTNITFDYNLYDIGSTSATGTHDLTGDPLFVNPGNDPTTANFNLQAASPAVDSAAAGPYTPTVDILGAPRPQGAHNDRGAYERLASAPPPNQPPVIDSGAWASPNPVVSADQTTVSVTAHDPDSGPNPLTYTWSKTSGPGTVSFSPNGTTGADTATATFSASGAYTLKVTVSDGAATVTSSISSLNVTLPVVTPPSPPTPPTPPTGGPTAGSGKSGGCALAAGTTGSTVWIDWALLLLLALLTAWRARTLPAGPLHQ